MQTFFRLVLFLLWTPTRITAYEVNGEQVTIIDLKLSPFLPQKVTSLHRAQVYHECERERECECECGLTLKFIACIER